MNESELVIRILKCIGIFALLRGFLAKLYHTRWRAVIAPRQAGGLEGLRPSK
jgi:hypothetical protein